MTGGGRRGKLGEMKEKESHIESTPLLFHIFFIVSVLVFFAYYTFFLWALFKTVIVIFYLPFQR